MELDEAAGDLDLALVGVVEAGEDVHQGRLAGAVLAEERVDLARRDLERHAVVRTMPGNRFVIPRMATAAPFGTAVGTARSGVHGAGPERVCPA